MPKIFVSYRRIDSQERAHRIADWLVNKYGLENVFIDVDRIPGATDFAREIENSLDESDVLVVVIGYEWVDEMEKRTHSDELDFVRFEVAKGFRDGMKVIPLLLERDVMIDVSRLPDDVRDIVTLNYMYARSSDFHRDMDSVKNIIDEAFPIVQTPKTIVVPFDTGSGTVPIPLTPAMQQLLKRLEENRTAQIAIMALLIIGLLFFVVMQNNRIQHSITPTPANLETQAALLLTQESEPTVTETPDPTLTVEAIMAGLREQATADALATIDAFTDTPQPTSTNSPTQTPDFTSTANSIMTQDSIATQDAILQTQQAQTQIAQATLDAPTNTPQPTATYTPTPSFTPTLSPTPTPNTTLTAQVFANQTATENAFATQVVVNAIATDNAQSTRDAKQQSTVEAVYTQQTADAQSTRDARQQATIEAVYIQQTANAISTRDARQQATIDAANIQRTAVAEATAFTDSYEIFRTSHFSGSTLPSADWRTWNIGPTVADGVASLTGVGRWGESAFQTGFILIPNIGIIQRFKISPEDLPAEVSIAFERGDWDEETYRNISLDFYVSTNSKSGVNRSYVRTLLGKFGRQNISHNSQSRVILADIWYDLIMLIHDDGEFTIQVRQADVPHIILYETVLAPTGDGWDWQATNDSWAFVNTVRSGTLIVDRVDIIRLDD